MKLVKKTIVTTILLLLIVFSLFQFSVASSTELTDKENAVAFLKDVVGLDISKYNITIAYYQKYPTTLPEINAYYAEANYIFEAPGSKIEASCHFRNNTLTSLSLNELVGSMLFAQPQPKDLLSAAKELIQKYQTYSGASYLQTMRNMLDPVKEINPITVISDNIKLEISTNEPFTYIKWLYTANGIDVQRKGLSFSFQNGSLMDFGNTWDFYTVVNTDLILSRDDAVRIAKEHAQNYSWKVNNITVSGFKILDSPTTAEFSMQPREGNTLYPWWNIQLYLDKVYPGMVGSIQVGLWADTEEITNIEAISNGGSVTTNDLSLSTTSLPSAQQHDISPLPESQLNMVNICIIVAAVASITMALAVVVIKRKRK